MNHQVELNVMQEQLQVTQTQLNAAEAALRERNLQLEYERQRYQSLLNLSPDGYLVTDTWGIVQEANQAILDQLSIQRDGLLGQPFLRFVAHPDATQFYTQLDDRLTQAQHQPWEITLKPDQGEPFPAVITLALNDAPGTTLETRLLWWVRNISEAKRNETEQQKVKAALQASQECYRAIVEEQNDLLSRWAPDRTLLSVNKAYCRFYGTIPEELLGKDLLSVVNEGLRDDLRLVLDSVTRTLSPEHPMAMTEEWSVDANGQSHYYLWSNRGIFDGEGRLLEIQSMGHDITDRKRVEDALRVSEAHNRALISALPDLVMRIDHEGTYLDFFANTNFPVMGRTGDFVGTTVYENLSPELAQQRMEAIHATLATGSIQFYEQDIEIEGQIQTEEVRVVPYKENEALLLLRDISDRKRAEKALQDSEARFQQLASASPGVIYTILEHPDKSISCEYLSPAFEEIHEISIAEARDNPGLMPAQIHPEDRALYQQEAAKSYALGQFKHEWRIITPSGKIKWIGSHSRAEVRDDGVIAWHGIVLDISDRKQAELERKAATEALNLLNQDLENQVKERSRALAESEIRFQHIFEQSPIGMGITNIHYQFVKANPKLCEITGYSESELLRLTSEEITYPEDYVHQSRLHQEILDNRRSEFSLEKRYIKKNQDLVWVNLTVALVRNLDGHPVYFIIMVKDISDRKRLEEEQSRLTAILEASTDYIFMTDAAGNMIWNNTALKDLVGLASDAAVTQRHFSDYTPQWAVELMREKGGYPSLMTKGNWLGETALLNAQGQEIPVSQLVLSLKSPPEKVEFYASIMRDMRAQKAYEQELRQSNAELERATRLKDQFLANMSHELRTPLNAILGMAEGLKDEVYGDINEQQQGALETIEQSGTHLLELITDILDLAKIEAGQEELHCTPNSIQQICQSSLSFVKQQAFQKRIQLAVKIQPLLPHLRLDERRIRQVLINLLNNAVKFTPEGGSITLEAKLVRISSVAEDPPLIRIAVIDTGIGISPENLSKLFQPFVQIDSALNRKYEGTGLGLALVKRIIELHGGTISVNSQVGRGSGFTIELPCQELDIPLPPQPISPSFFSPALAPQPVPARSPLILLADDNEANTRSVASYLTVKGFRIILARNGHEAVTLTQESLPDLVLMDIQMPGMDGLEAIGRIKRQRNLAHIPIIALTALAMKSDHDRCLEAGVSEYLTKPVKLNQLANTIQQFLILQDNQQ